MSQDTCQKKMKNQILSEIFNGVLVVSEVSYLSNALLVEESVTMLPNVLTRIRLTKGRNLLDGTRNRMQLRKVTTLMKAVMAYQIVMKMNEVMIINF